MDEKKVLIVDDEEDICLSLKEIIERKGGKVFASIRAEDAWEIFQNEKPTSCILDLHMPYSKFDGLELLQKIRDVDQNVTCLILTRMEDKMELAKEKGANGYFIKPLDMEELNRLIEEAMK